MCSSKTEDTQEICRREQETTEILTLIKRRATGRIHCGYWLTAIGSTAAALLAWGLLLTHGLADTAHMTRQDGTVMTLFVVLGGIAIGSNVAFVLVRNQQRLAAERDRIDAYNAERAAQAREREHAELLDALDNLRGEKWRQMIDEFTRSGGVKQGSVSDIRDRQTRV
jgi:hypothetical protein